MMDSTLYLLRTSCMFSFLRRSGLVEALPSPPIAENACRSGKPICGNTRVRRVHSVSITVSTISGDVIMTS